MPAKKTGAKRPAKRATSRPKRPAARSAAPRVASRADKGEGEAAVQARIAALAEPARGIMQRLHPLIQKHGKGLEPQVRWGFAVYKRKDAFVLIAAPRKNHVTFGTGMDTEVQVEPLKFTRAEDVKEAEVAAIVKRVLR
ncbi:MAG: DUF1801 domain-containing protein [Halobacteriales archaeon]|nr:DUF1801 domain-containing protein [Halobacteriales archaeon]